MDSSHEGEARLGEPREDRATGPTESRPPSATLPSTAAALLSILFFLAIAAFLFRRVGPTDTMAGGDITGYFYPNRTYGFGSLLEGEIPLWDPYQFCGRPFVASIQSALFYPLNALFLLLDVNLALSVSFFLHVVLAASGMWLLIWHLTRRVLPSVVAGTVYMLSGFLSAHLVAGHVTICCAYPWLPYVVFSLDKALRQRSLGWALGGGLLFSFPMLAGHPQVGYYTLLVACLYAAGYGWTHADGEGRWRSMVRAAGPLAVLAGVGLLLSAIQLVPAGLLAQHSTRAGGSSYEFATTYSFPLANAVTYVVPFFFGDGLSLPGHWGYWGRWSLYELLPYVGVLPLCLLLLGAFSRCRLARFMTLLGLLAVLLSFGRYAPYYRTLSALLPGLSRFRAPARILFLFAFAASAASGLLLAWFLSEMELGHSPRLLTRARSTLAALSVVLLATFLASGRMETTEGSLWAGIVKKSMSFDDRAEPRTEPVSERFLTRSLRFARTNVLVAFLWAALGAGVVGLATHRRTRRAFPAAVLALITVDLLWSAERYVHGLERPGPRLTRPVIEAIKPAPSVVPPRITSARSTEALVAGGLDGIAHVGGRDPALLKRYAEYMGLASDTPAPLRISSAEPTTLNRLLRLTGISHAVLGTGHPAIREGTQILRDKGVRVFRLPRPFPRAFLVHRAVVVASREERLKRLPEIDPLEEALVERPLPRSLSPCPTGATEEVRITRYTPHLVELSVSAAADALVVLTDAYYPAWRATLDGRPTDVFAVNHLFRGVVVPRGAHQIQFTYSRHPFYTGAFITAGTLVFVAIFLLRGFVKRERRSAKPPGCLGRN